MRNLWLTSLVLCILSILPLSAPADTLQAEPVEHLRVVASPYEPFVFERHGKLVGFDVDLLDMVCRLNNWTYTIELVSFQEMLRQIAFDSADITIGSVYITDERKERFAYSAPYLHTGLVLVSRTVDPMHTVDELSDIRVGVKSKATGETYATAMLRKHPGAFEIRSYESTDNSFVALRNHEVDAVLNDFINSQFIIAEKISRRVYHWAETAGSKPADQCTVSLSCQRIVSHTVAHL